MVNDFFAVVRRSKQPFLRYLNTVKIILFEHLRYQKLYLCWVCFWLSIHLRLHWNTFSSLLNAFIIYSPKKGFLIISTTINLNAATNCVLILKFFMMVSSAELSNNTFWKTTFCSSNLAPVTRSSLTSTFPQPTQPGAKPKLQIREKFPLQSTKGRKVSTHGQDLLDELKV